MDGRIRHDIRHPVATISMIASTMAAFAGNVDLDTLETYRAQVKDELVSLRQITDTHGVSLDLDELAKTVDGFVEGLPQSAEDLHQACQRVLVEMTVQQGEDAY
ncbi:MAG: hypothetical protein ABIS18_10075 [Actinomycetota bacterium]